MIQSRIFLESIPKEKRTRDKVILSIVMAAACNGDDEAAALVWKMQEEKYGNKQNQNEARETG